LPRYLIDSMSRLRLLTLFLFTLPIFAGAQVIFEHSDTSKFVFTFVPFERSVNNKVLNQLALAHLKVPEKTSFNYTLRHRYSVSYRQSDSLYILLDVKPLAITGDIMLRDFNLERLLVPSAYNISILVKNPQSGVILDTRKTVVMEEGMTAVATFADTLWKDGTEVKVSILGLNFTDEDYHRMELELTSVRDYYAASMLADTLQNRIRKARKNPPSLAEVVKIYTTGIKGISLIDNSMNSASEIVPGSDPMKISQKMPLLRYNFKEYGEYISLSDKPIMTGDAYNEFADAYIRSLQDAGKLSRSVDYYSSPFFYKLYANSINSGQLCSAWRIIMKETASRGIRKFDLSKLHHEIIKAYLKESGTLLKANRYVEAVDLLSGAEKYIYLVPGDNASDEIANALALARKGLITSYTEIMQKALDKNLISLAEKYLTEIDNYTSRHQMTNAETGPFKEIYLKMADSYIHLGYNSLSKKSYYDALAEFTKAGDLISGYQSLLSTKAADGQLIAVRSIYQDKIELVENYILKGDYDHAYTALEEARHFASLYDSFYPDKTYQFELESKIASIRYRDLLNSTPKSVGSEISHETIQRLAEAVELLNKYHYADRALLDTLTMRIGVKYLNEQFSKARLKYWASQPDTSLMIANEAYATATALDLHYLPVIKEQYEKVIALAAETYCNEAKGEYHSILGKADLLFKTNKIEAGVKKAGEAKELAFKKANCGLTTTDVNKLLSKYKQQIRWNDLVTEAFGLLEQKQFIEATALIQQAESVYSYYRLDTTGLVNVGYFDLAMKSDDNSLITFAISFLVNHSKPDQALQLLDKLRTSGYPKEQSVTIQETLARTLAQRDITETPNLNVKLMLKTYTRNNDWYARFASVYKYYAGKKD